MLTFIPTFFVGWWDTPCLSTDEWFFLRRTLTPQVSIEIRAPTMRPVQWSQSFLTKIPIGDRRSSSRTGWRSKSDSTITMRWVVTTGAWIYVEGTGLCERWYTVTNVSLWTRTGSSVPDSYWCVSPVTKKRRCNTSFTWIHTHRRSSRKRFQQIWKVLTWDLKKKRVRTRQFFLNLGTTCLYLLTIHLSVSTYWLDITVSVGIFPPVSKLVSRWGVKWWQHILWNTCGSVLEGIYKVFWVTVNETIKPYII